MSRIDSPAGHTLGGDNALRLILEGTASEIGKNFFTALVFNMARVMNTCGAWVTEYQAEKRRLRALAFWLHGGWISDFEIDIDGTPCQQVIDTAELVHYPDNIVELFPNSLNLINFGAVSYMGVPLKAVGGAILGHMAVIDDRPMPEEPRALTLFRIFAARAAAEMERLRAEAEIIEQKEKLHRLVQGAMDGIIEIDGRLNINTLNPAAQKMLGLQPEQGAGTNLAAFLFPEGRRLLTTLIQELDAASAYEPFRWIEGGIEVIDSRGRQIHTEATLSRIDQRRHTSYLLILRNINDKIAARNRIRLLTRQTEYLKAEIQALNRNDEIIGDSPPIQQLLRSIRQVAPTRATVLIHGETGTGKELVARAIHNASPRSDRPFISVNCAALPAGLVESELFGHEPGAFTGADRRRKGRFELADGGTILLDEISELPLELQSKLLRVLQEMQFERVGGTRTLMVDVRVIAATNRHLTDEIIVGRFRADLYYRLNVYPIRVPPLREHLKDIALLVDHFVPRIAQRLGKTIKSVNSRLVQQLSGYHWPGNVRELINLLERAVITSSDGSLHLFEPIVTPPADARKALPVGPVMLSDLATIERRYIENVLEATGGRISGAHGAARILGLNPSTLRFRMKKMGIVRFFPPT